MKCAFTPEEEGTGRARTHGVPGYYFVSGGANPMMCRHGRCPKEVRVSEDLCGLLTPAWQCASQSAPTAQVQRDPCTTSRSDCFSKLDANCGF